MDIRTHRPVILVLLLFMATGSNTGRNTLHPTLVVTAIIRFPFGASAVHLPGETPQHALGATFTTVTATTTLNLADKTTTIASIVSLHGVPPEQTLLPV